MVAAFAVAPLAGLPLLAFSLPFFLYARNLGSLAFSMPELILLCAIAGAILHALWRQVRNRSLSFSLASLATELDGPIALLLAAALLSLLASEVLRVSLRDLRTLILEPVAAFYLCVWLLRRRGDAGWLLAGLLAGGSCAALLALYQYFFTDHVVAVEGSRRILGPYLSPNHLGLYLGRILPMALSVALFLPVYRWIALLVCGIVGVALLLTFSVGAWIASFLAVATALLLWRRKALVALAAATCVILVAAVPLLSIDRISSHLDVTRGTTFFRLQLWEASLRMIRDHPALGVGMDNFLYQYRSTYLLPDAVADPNLSHPHNLVLNFWLQMGLPGLAALLWLSLALVRTARGLLRSPRPAFERAVLVGVIGALVDLVVHGMVDNSYFLVDLAFQFWLLIGLVVFVRRQGTSPCPTALKPNRVN